MKYVILILALFLIVGCEQLVDTGQQDTESMESMDNNTENMNDSMGKGPGDNPMAMDHMETEENNAQIFDNLDTSLTDSEMVEYSDGISGFLAQPKAEGTYGGD
jgi:hypothetical protein